jgi:hypothetical protein
MMQRSGTYPCLCSVALYPVLQGLVLRIQAQQSSEESTQEGQGLLQQPEHLYNGANSGEHHPKD